MTAEILIRYLHFISIFGIVSSLVAEHLLLKPIMNRKEIKRISLVDSIYGLSAILAVGAGFILWFVVGKPAIYYSQNWIFIVKVGLAILLGILSIYPTLFFNKQRKGAQSEEVEIPVRVKWMIRFQLMIMFLIPLLATSMAKGIGRF